MQNNWQNQFKIKRLSSCGSVEYGKFFRQYNQNCFLTLNFKLNRLILRKIIELKWNDNDCYN